MTEYPLLCLRGADCRPVEHGGPRRTEQAWLCPVCIDYLRQDLAFIADSWEDLEEALASSERVDGEKGTQKHGMVSVGTHLNEKASQAMRLATETVWFVLGVLRDDYDDLGRTFAPPAGTTGTLARWVATWHVDHLSRRTADETAIEIASDVAGAKRAVRSAAYPSGVHWIEVGLTCEEHGVSDLGERVPCEGTMRALVGRGALPDLVCTVDPTHTVDPTTWAREGWRRAHRRGLNPSGFDALVTRLRTGA